MAHTGAVVATIVARNYGAMAQVLADSVRQHDPGTTFVTLLVDGTEADRAQTGLGEVWLLSDLGLPADEIEPMVVHYSVMELATAVKPALLRALRARFEVAVYLDPDIVVLAPLTAVHDAARTRAVALVPHVLGPMPQDGKGLPERAIMHAGIFNLGFVAVGPGSEDFLDWWHQRLRTAAVVDFARAQFTDQRWIDWVPALWPHVVLRDPGLDVAYWNLHERPLTRAADGTLLAGGAPVTFVHLSGFDAALPWVLSHFQGDHPRVEVSASPVLAEVCVDYAARLAAAGHDQRRREPYGHAELDGLALTPGTRRVYREATVGILPFPAPPARPVSDPAALRAWLTTEVRVAPTTDLAPLDLATWHDRPDLRGLFPDPLGADAAPLRDRLRSDAAARAAWEALGAVPRPPAGPVPFRVVAVGSPEPRGAVVQTARRVAAELATAAAVELVEREPAGYDAAGEAVVPPWRHLVLGPPAAGPDDPAGGENAAGGDAVTDPSGAAPPTTIVCVDADRLAAGDVRAAFADGPRVAFWLTTHPEHLPHHAAFLDALDEVWTTPELAAAVAEVTGTPIRVMPVPAAPAGTGDRVDREIVIDGRCRDLALLTDLDLDGVGRVRVAHAAPSPVLLDALRGIVGDRAPIEPDPDTWPAPAPAPPAGEVVELEPLGVARPTGAGTVVAATREVAANVHRRSLPVDHAEPGAGRVLGEQEVARVSAEAARAREDHATGRAELERTLRTAEAAAARTAAELAASRAEVHALREASRRWWRRRTG